MLNQQFFSYTYQRWISGQWILMLLLGCGTASLIILGGALMNLFGNLLIPLFLVIVTVSALQLQVTAAVKNTSTTVFQSFQRFSEEFQLGHKDLYLTHTQRYFVERSQTDTSLGLLILAVRRQSDERLREVISPLTSDFGYDFVADWLRQVSVTSMTPEEHEWLWTTIHAPRSVINVDDPSSTELNEKDKSQAH